MLTGLTTAPCLLSVYLLACQHSCTMTLTTQWRCVLQGSLGALAVQANSQTHSHPGDLLWSCSSQEKGNVTWQLLVRYNIQLDGTHPVSELFFFGLSWWCWWWHTAHRWPWSAEIMSRRENKIELLTACRCNWHLVMDQQAEGSDADVVNDEMCRTGSLFSCPQFCSCTQSLVTYSISLSITGSSKHVYLFSLCGWARW